MTAVAGVGLVAVAVAAFVVTASRDTPTVGIGQPEVPGTSSLSPSLSPEASGGAPSASPSPSPTATATTPGPARVAASNGTWPTANGQQPVGQTITVPMDKEYDGGLKRFYGTGSLGSGGQSESQPPMFKLEPGAVLKNVILGAPAADGVHCTGSCTLVNVWWEDVGEDAATFRGTSANQTMTIDGGGARHATDKVFQHNGPGTMVIKRFVVEDFGKLYRSCGNCSTQHQRHVVIEGVRVLAPGKTLVGINTNYGDTATVRNVTLVGSAKSVTVCEKYKGVTDGEPAKLGSGADGTNCRYSTSDISYS